MFIIGQEVICVAEYSDFEGFVGEIIGIGSDVYWVKFHNRKCPIPFIKDGSLEATKYRKEDW